VRHLTVSDVRPPSAYAPVREAARRHLIELKRDRRVLVGELVAVVFENRDTVRGLIEEVLRAGHIEAPRKIAEEIDLFNGLIPEQGELSATLFLELTDWVHAACLSQLHGLERCLALAIGDTTCLAVPSDGGDPEGCTTCVHYLRFPLGPTQRTGLLAGAGVALTIDHPGYHARTVLSERQRAALAADLVG
jgi:hypothetical protein